MKYKIGKISVLVIIGILLATTLSSLMVGMDNGAEPDITPESALTTSDNSSPSITLPTEYFTENTGQISNEKILYYVNSDAMQVGFLKSAVLFRILEVGKSQEQVREILVRVTFEGANQIEPMARDELSHKSNFFLGNDPAK
jgi:hypothetical protein